MEIYPTFQIAPKLLEAAEKAEAAARPRFQEIESIQRYNQQKMLAAVSYTHLDVYKRQVLCMSMTK